MNDAPLRLAGAAALLIAGAYFLLSHYRPASDAIQAQISPATLYATQFPDLRGQPQALGQWQGKLLVLNFWASWCAPCREEIPHLIQAQRSYGGRGVQIVGVAVDSPDKAGLYAREMGVDYPVLVDEAGGLALAKRLGNRPSVLPFTVIIDPQGRVAGTVVGGVDEARLEQVLQHALPRL